MTNQEAIERIRTHMYVHASAERCAIYITEALQMAINVLEMQEPMEPIKTKYFTTLCGQCRHEIDKLAGDKFCPHCGRGVKWDG